MGNHELVSHWVSTYKPEVVYCCTPQTKGRVGRERSIVAVTVEVPLTNPVVLEEQRRKHSGISSLCN